MPKCDDVRIRAWRHRTRNDRVDQSKYIEFVVETADKAHQRRCYTSAGEPLYEFLDARLKERGYAGPKSQKAVQTQ